MGGGAEQCRAAGPAERGTSPVERGLECPASDLQGDVVDRLRRYYARAWPNGRHDPGGTHKGVREVYGGRWDLLADDEMAYGRWLWLAAPCDVETAVAQMRLIGETLSKQYLATPEALEQSSELTDRLDDLAAGILVLNASEAAFQVAQAELAEAEETNARPPAVMGDFVITSPIYEAAMDHFAEAKRRFDKLRAEFLSYHPIYAGIEQLIASGGIDKAGLAHSLAAPELTQARLAALNAARKAIGYFEDAAKATESRLAELRAGEERGNWKPMGQLLKSVIHGRYPKGSRDEPLKYLAFRTLHQRIGDSDADMLCKAAMIVGLAALAIAPGSPAWFVIVVTLAESGLSVAALAAVAKEREKDEPLDRASFIDRTLKATPHSGDLTFDVVITVAGIIFAVASVARLLKPARSWRGLSKPGPADPAPPAKPGDPVPEPPAKPAAAEPDPAPARPKPVHEEPSFQAGREKIAKEGAARDERLWEQARKEAGPPRRGESTRAPGVVRRSKAEVDARGAAGGHARGPAKGQPRAKRGSSEEDIREVMEQEKKRGAEGGEEDFAPEGTDREVGEEYAQESKTGTVEREDPQTGETWKGRDVPLERQPYDDTLSVSSPSEILAAAMERDGLPRPRAVEMPGAPKPAPGQAVSGRDAVYQAHHIVPEGHAEAEAARELLKEAGIDINSSKNGVWLPTGANIPNPDAIARHEFTYTRNYVLWLTEKLQTARARGLVEPELRSIRRILQEGKTPWASADVKLPKPAME